MKFSCIVGAFAALASFPLSASAQDSPSTAPPNEAKSGEESKKLSSKNAAISYFEALTQADLEKVAALVAVPFTIDGQGAVKSKEELAVKHKEIVGLKGKRAVPAYTVSVPKDAKQLDRGVFPSWVVFRISITNTEYQVDIYVLPGVGPKVIGFASSNRK